MQTSTSWLGLAAIGLLGYQTHVMAQSDDQVSYNGEVGRIINENCVVCHREGGIGPMQLGSYDQVRPWAPLIQLRVANKEMPPLCLRSRHRHPGVAGRLAPAGRYRYHSGLG